MFHGYIYMATVGVKGLNTIDEALYDQAPTIVDRLSPLTNRAMPPVVA